MLIFYRFFGDFSSLLRGGGIQRMDFNKLDLDNIGISKKRGWFYLKDGHTGR
jgi:hypothetical protein